MTSPQRPALPCRARFCGWLLALCVLASAAFGQRNPAPTVYMSFDAGVAFFPETGRGTLLLGTELNAVVDFRVAADGQFSAPFQSNGRALTVAGTLSESMVTARVPEMNLTFSAPRQPGTGRTADIAGLYLPTPDDNPLGSSFPRVARGTAILVGATGEAMVVVNVVAFAESNQARMTVETATSRITFFSGALTGGGSFDAASGTFTGNISGTRSGPVLLKCVSSTIPRTDRVINVSARGWVTPATGRTLTAGFIVEGPGEKRMLLRALGPGFAGYDGRATVIANPRLRLYDSTHRLLAENDDWSGELSPTFAQVGAFPLTPGSRDAALLTTLRPGVYTLQISGETGNGQALAEIYDVEAHTRLAAPRQLINGSALGRVETGQVMSSGFVVVGNRPKKMLIRAVGPSLAAFGITDAAPAPVLLVTGRGGGGRSESWSEASITQTEQEIVAATREVGAFPLPTGSKDAAVLGPFAPGDYVATVAGTTGTVLIEVYELP